MITMRVLLIFYSYAKTPNYGARALLASVHATTAPGWPVLTHPGVVAHAIPLRAADDLHQSVQRCRPLDVIDRTTAVKDEHDVKATENANWRANKKHVNVITFDTSCNNPNSLNNQHQNGMHPTCHLTSNNLSFFHKMCMR